MVSWNIVMLEDGVGGPNLTWDNDMRANLQRLLGVPISRGIFLPQNEDADIHLITSCNYTKYLPEIAFAKKMKAKGKKVIASLASDGRWLNGSNLMGPDGTNYTGLLAEVDGILSEVHPSWKVYGRYQSKVIPLAQPLESQMIKDNPTRDIDVLTAGSNGTGGLAYATEVIYMLLEKNPNLNCVQIVHPHYLDILRKNHPRLRFETASFGPFFDYLGRAKVIVNMELKARGGRIPMEGFYTSTPVICSSGAFFSQLYPDLSFNKIDLEYIVELVEYAIQKRVEITNRAKELAKPYFISEWKKTIYKTLGLQE
jgi:hypothetical protein